MVGGVTLVEKIDTHEVILRLVTPLEMEGLGGQEAKVEAATVLCIVMKKVTGGLGREVGLRIQISVFSSLRWMVDQSDQLAMNLGGQGMSLEAGQEQVSSHVPLFGPRVQILQQGRTT